MSTGRYPKRIKFYDVILIIMSTINVCTTSHGSRVAGVVRLFIM